MSMTGVIQEIVAKSVANGKTAYDIVVGGQAYGYGLYPPKAKEGDYVMFDIDDSRGYKNVARNSLKVNRNKPPAEAVAEAASTAPKAGTSGGLDSRQDSIVRQSSMNYAILWLTAMANAGALSIPTTKGKGQEYMDTLRQKYTQEFYESNTGVAWKDISPTAKPADDADEVEEEEAPADAGWE